MSALRFGSVCSGIEAASQAWHPLGWRSVFFSEIEKFPSAVLAHHYGSNMPDEEHSSNGVPNYGDMTKFKEWPDHGQQSGSAIDVLVGGTPCQSFSVAGLRKGLDDPRGNLMLTFGAIAQRYKPRWIVWENVPGVLSSNSGRDFGAFLRLLGECGYGFAYRVLDAQYVRVDGFGRAVPQRRRRVFVVGHLGDWRPAAAVLSEPEGMFGHTAPSRKTEERPSGYTQSSFGQYREGCGTLTAQGGDLGGGSEVLVPFDKQALGQFGKGETSSTLAARDYKDASDLVAFNSRQDTEVTGDRSGPLDSSSPQAQAVVYEVHEQAGRIKKLDEVGSTVTQKYGTGGGNVPIVQEVSHTLKGEGFDASEDGTGRGTPIIHDNFSVRRLTPIECERLQGFPDNFTQIPWRNKMIDQCPDGPRYKALGNSMAVNVMRWLGVRIEMTDQLMEGME